MLEIGVLKNFDSGTYKAGVQFVGSLTTYFDDISVAKNIPSSALVIGNYVILAIPGGNPKDACVIASWPQGSSGGGGGGSKIQDADGDTSWDTEQSADEDKVRGKVKGVEVFLLDDAGVLTLAKQSSVRAYKSTAQSIPSGTFTELNLNAENWDIQSEFDTTNYRFTAKTAGKYLVTAAIWYAATTMVVNKYYQINLYKNGANEASGRFHSACAGEYLCAPLSVVVSLAVNDYLELYAHHGSGVTQTIEAGFIHCWFCVTKLT